MTYEEAAKKFAKCRDKTKGYRLGNNTRLQQRGRVYAVRYHNTDVVLIRPDGTYRIHSGGWPTLTTKDRINRFSPYCLNQTNGMWHIGDILFTEGMLIDSNGNPVNASTPAMADVLKIKRRVDRKFNQFVKLIIEQARYQDIGSWESYSRRNIPRHNARQHLKKLWNTVLVETSNSQWSASRASGLFVWIYYAVSSRGYRDKSLVFRMTRQDVMNGRVSYLIEGDLRNFMKHRKPLIVNMILSGEITDGTMRVSKV